MIATVTLNGLTMGTGTPYQIDEPGISGLGTPQTKTQDTQFDGRDGSSAAPDFLDIRVITVPLLLDAADDEGVLDLLDDVNDAWAPARDGVDVELVVSLPGRDLTFTGRPRGVEADPIEIGDGTILALCRFDAMQPTAATGS